MQRRAFLALAGAGVLAGCPARRGGGGSGGNGGGGGTTTDRGETYGLGETATYTGDGQSLEITPTKALLREQLVYGRRSSVRSETPPGSNDFLTVFVEVDNTGDATARAPREATVRIGSKQFEVERTLAYDERAFDTGNRILAGASYSGWLVFAVPSEWSSADLRFEFGVGDDTTSIRYRLRAADIERVTYDYTGLATGDQVTIGTEDLEYTFVARSAEITDGYSYSAGGRSYEHEADTGRKFVLVSVAATNFGEEAVRIPRRRSTSLQSDGSVYSAGFYQDEARRYEGGEIPTGETRAGRVLFEVPATASDHTFQVFLTDSIRATWGL